MKVWKYTSAQLIGRASVRPDAAFAPEFVMPWESDNIDPIPMMPNYATAPAKGHRGLADQVLLERDGGGWKCVGHYIQDTIVVFEKVQNLGLADVLFLRCIEHRSDVPITSAFTESGLTLFKRVHEKEVLRARDAGCLVPAEVLEEYGFS
jgi:hypothetical protein